jgi:hypothetical protein
MFEPKKDKVIKGWGKLGNAELHNVYSLKVKSKAIPVTGLGGL